MAAISNITGIQGRVTPQIPAAPKTSGAGAPNAGGSTPLSGGGKMNLEDLAAELGAKLDQLGQGHKIAMRRDDYGVPIVEVLNKEGEVINQFPPEKILNLRRVLADLSGMVINQMT